MTAAFVIVGLVIVIVVLVLVLSEYASGFTR